MNKNFVKCETVLKLVDAGFELPKNDVLGCYSNGFTYSEKILPVKFYIGDINESSKIRQLKVLCVAPVYTQVLDWFSDKNIIIEPTITDIINKKYFVKIHYPANGTFETFKNNQIYDSLQDALNNGFLIALKFLQ